MDSGLILSPAAGIPAAATRTDTTPVSVASAAPVATELPQEQAVGANGAVQSGAGDFSRRGAPSPQPDAAASFVVQKLAIDPATHVVVFSTVDKDTGTVLNQFPDKAFLRQRAYYRKMLADEALHQGSSENRIA